MEPPESRPCGQNGLTQGSVSLKRAAESAQARLFVARPRYEIPSIEPGAAGKREGPAARGRRRSEGIGSLLQAPRLLAPV